MDFCSRCGKTIQLAVPEGDGRERHVCTACGTVHYLNPRIVVGCIIEDGGRLLLCRRAIEPRRGYWTVPAGYLEIGESTMAGAVRETLEEAQAHVEIVAPYAHLDIPHIGQVYVLYRARMRQAGFGPGPESLEVRWFELDEIPQADLAFNAVGYSLSLYRQDVRQGLFHHHQATVHRNGERDYELVDKLSTPLR